MMTSIDKALVALFMAGVYLLKNVAGINVGLSPEVFNSIIVAATPVLVYLIPNLPWADSK